MQHADTPPEDRRSATVASSGHDGHPSAADNSLESRQSAADNSPESRRLAADSSLEGRRFAAVAATGDGDVDAATLFDYHQEGTVVWATYAGGEVRLGHLVGTRSGGTLEFRYAHLTTGGDTASGHCVSRIEALPDGRLRLHETWQWESRDGAGTSVVEEVAADGSMSSGSITSC